MPASDEAASLLKELFKATPGQAVNLWFKGLHNERTTLWSSSDPAALEQLAARAEGLAEGGDVYFSTCPAGSIPSETPEHKRITQSMVSAVPALFLDLDTREDPAKAAKAVPATRAEAVETLRRLPLPPSAMVGSGRGVHAYWFLTSPLPVDVGKPLLRAHAEAVARELGFKDLDTHASEPSRVLRLPGTQNHKGAEPVPVKLLELSGRRYSRAEVEAFIGEAVQPEPAPQALPAGGKSCFTDEELLRRARENAKFERLFRGDCSDYAGDHSRADSALVSMLLFWSSRDYEQTDRLFRASGLMRDKWDSMRGSETYGELTMRRASLEMLEVYEPREPELPALTTYRAAVSAADLNRMLLPDLTWFVDSLLCPGLTILASPPKFGKSWFSLFLSLCISTGRPFLGFNTTQCGVLYLALEDSLGRLQSRMRALLSVLKTEAPDRLSLQIEAPTLNGGLLTMLEAHIAAHPDCRVVIIDTLEKIRDGARSNREGAYSADYRETGELKRFADGHGICVLLVHHLRKLGDETDVMARISGTTGLTGAADTLMVLSKRKRTDADTTLSLTGRDVEAAEYVLAFDKEAKCWRMLGSSADVAAQAAARVYEGDPLVLTIRGLLAGRDAWTGTIGQLAEASEKSQGAALNDIPLSALGKRLRDLSPELAERDAIFHEALPGGRRLHRLYRAEL